MSPKQTRQVREANRQALHAALRMGRKFSLVRFPTILL